MEPSNLDSIGVRLCVIPSQSTRHCPPLATYLLLRQAIHAGADRHLSEGRISVIIAYLTVTLYILSCRASLPVSESE